MEERLRTTPAIETGRKAAAGPLAAVPGGAAFAVVAAASLCLALAACPPSTLPDDRLDLQDTAGCRLLDGAALAETAKSVGIDTTDDRLRCILLSCRRQGDDAGIAALAAKVSFLLAERQADGEARKKLAAEGKRWAEHALLLGLKDDASVYYYLALNLALAVRDSASLALKQLPEMKKNLEEAMRLDPDIDHGGPLRLLGMLYLMAPPWPKGIGDGDKALELLERVVEKHPEHPLNHAFFAKALVELEEDDAVERATEHLRKAIDLLDEPEWHAARNRWMKEIREIAGDIEIDVSPFTHRGQKAPPPRG